ncbi:Sodium/hydrogen exchanger family-domain-containing protein [Glomus cerebriforme]|uniref:Sodium/hydrogen exchanger n=1 Tax=Glomus cerebriforme TaxID=658196 RepID=A0A397TBI3_9GLOM|nr:Sodium/hydrogen exchanger family-domain-containing protein [Glomus cerebriforme]
MAPNAEEEELYSSWALLIQIFLLIGILWTNYCLHLKHIKVINETVVSIFAGMIVGLIIRISPASMIQDMVSFNYTYFFNLLLPPIILNSGYEMQKEKFFRNFGTIFLFAFVGTLMSTLVIGILVRILALLEIDSLSLSLLDSMIFGSILSATDSVAVLTIFRTLKVDSNLYSIIFGETMLNNAVSIVLYETLKQYRDQEFHASNISHAILSLILKFGASLSIGVLYSQLRQYSSLESCIIALMAYSSYLLSNGLHSTGVVSLLFCGIILKHYAFDNMSLKTKRTTKYMFHVLAKLSEKFIFIYLGLTLFTKTDLEYKPFFIFFTAIFICLGRYFAIFPLSYLMNAVSKYRNGNDSIPREHSIMLFWTVRGAVTFALSAGLKGGNANAMLTTILVVVVISVIVFGSTTNKMLEILEIKTDIDDGENDNESDIRARLNNITTNEPNQKHWFISFDNRFLKPFFTLQKEQQYVPTHHNEDDHVENFGLVIMNKSVNNNNINENIDDPKSDSNDTCANVITINDSNLDSGNQSSENIPTSSSTISSNN